MNERRMLAKNILIRDDFAEMPFGAQMLYIRANVEADDEGFIPSIKSLARSMGASSDDVAALKKSGLVIVFESGIAVITDWKIHNGNLRNDRSKPTIFAEEKNQIKVLPNGRYVLNSLDDNFIGKAKKSEKESKKVKKSKNCGATEQNRTELNRAECVVSRARAERGGSSSSDSFSKKATEGDEETEKTEPKTEQTESDFLDRAVSGFIFGQKMLRDSTDYEPIRATLRELMRIYGSQNVDKAAHIALENGHPGEVGYIKGVLRKISPIS